MTPNEYEYKLLFGHKAFRTNWGEKIKKFFIIFFVIALVGGGTFAWAWMTLDIGYQGDMSCLFVRCIKIKN